MDIKIVRLDDVLEFEARRYAVLHGRNAEFTSAYVEVLFYTSIAAGGFAVLGLFMDFFNTEVEIIGGIGLAGTFCFGMHKNTVEARSEKMQQIDAKFRKAGYHIWGYEDGVTIQAWK